MLTGIKIESLLRINCNNASSFIRLIDYNINTKITEPGAEFKVTGNFKEDKYKLEIHCIVNARQAEKMKNSQMMVTIVTKSNEIKIIKSTHETYTVEDKKISLTINSFNTLNKFMIGIIFQTFDKEFVEVVKISYRHMVTFDLILGYTAHL